MRRAVRVIQHVAGEGPGLIAVALEREGIAVEVARVDLGGPVPAELGGAGGLVVLGGPMGVYEANEHPHLRDELRLIEAALGAGMPVCRRPRRSEEIGRVLPLDAPCSPSGR